MKLDSTTRQNSNRPSVTRHKKRAYTHKPKTNGGGHGHKSNDKEADIDFTKFKLTQLPNGSTYQGTFHLQ